LRYVFEDCVLDTGRRELRRKAGLVAVEPQVFDLLVYLARNHGRVLTHAMIRTALSIEDSPAGQARLKQFISGLRRKIEADPQNSRWLVSEHGVGYALIIE